MMPFPIQTIFEGPVGIMTFAYTVNREISDDGNCSGFYFVSKYFRRQNCPMKAFNNEFVSFVNNLIDNIPRCCCYFMVTGILSYFSPEIIIQFLLLPTLSANAIALGCFRHFFLAKVIDSPLIESDKSTLGLVSPSCGQWLKVEQYWHGAT